MHLNDKQLHRLADTLLDALLGPGGATLAGDRHRALGCIEAVVRANQDQEAAIEKEAQRLLETYRAQAPDVDPQKMLALIKKKLAEEKGVPL